MGLRHIRLSASRGRNFRKAGGVGKQAYQTLGVWQTDAVDAKVEVRA